MSKPRVIIIGAGFAGLRAAWRLRGEPVDVLVLDKHNFHMFQPLLYEVAASGLQPDDIAQPVRAILRGAANVRFRLAQVTGIDPPRHVVRADDAELPYDYLVLAPGSTTNFFGVENAQRRALGLKDIREATAVRNRLLRSFEQAAVTPPGPLRDRLMTAVVIGGGPTGVELAGALAELKRHVLPRDYPDLDVDGTRIILAESTDRLLSALPSKLQHKAAQQLAELGVEVMFHAPVKDVTDDGIVLAGGSRIDAATVVWVAGVRGDPLGESLGVDMRPGRRVQVTPHLHLPDHPRVYVAGDLAFLPDARGNPDPMMAPVAMQQGELAAENILRAIAGHPQRVFVYRDKGAMATIGRRKAVAHVFGRQIWGFPAWALWLIVHLVQLVGFRNRILVLTNWVWNYFRYDRANRLVTDLPPADDATSPSNGASTNGRRSQTRAQPLRPLG
jgi:NADH dehydrogenase